MKAYNELIKIAYENPDKREKILGLFQNILKEATFTPPPFGKSTKVSTTFPLKPMLFWHTKAHKDMGKEQAGRIFGYLVQSMGVIYTVLEGFTKKQVLKKSDPNFKKLEKFIEVKDSMVNAVPPEWRKIVKYYVSVAEQLVRTADAAIANIETTKYDKIFPALKKNLLGIGKLLTKDDKFEEKYEAEVKKTRGPYATDDAAPTQTEINYGD
jgi:hypothetical protein